MRKIRLLTISATCEIGGSDINLLRLLSHLDKDEYDILHIFPYRGPIFDEFQQAGIKVKIVDMPRIRLFINPLRYAVFFINFLPTVLRIKKVIRGFKADVVCTSSMVNLYGALAAKFSQRPHILIAGEYLPVLRIFSPYFYFFSERIVCCSNLVSQLFKKSAKVLVGHHGIDLTEFSPDITSGTLKRQLCPDSNLVIMITRLAKWKGIEVFIRAANYIKENVKFMIFAEMVMGKERYLMKLKRMIEKLNLKEKVTIIMNKNKNIPQIISAADIVVHASLRPEPFGLVIIEAMAMGKPVVSTRLGGPLEIITDGLDGILIEPKDPKLLASTISGLLKAPGVAGRLGKNAREKIVEKFNIKDYATAFDNILKVALKGHSLK